MAPGSGCVAEALGPGVQRQWVRVRRQQERMIRESVSLED